MRKLLSGLATFLFWVAVLALGISIGLSGSWPLIATFGLIALFGGIVLRKGLPGWNLFSPLIAFPVAYLAYYLLGSIPITDAQEIAPPLLYLSVLIGAIGYLSGVSLYILRQPKGSLGSTIRFSIDVAGLQFFDVQLATRIARWAIVVGLFLLAISYRETGIPALSSEVSELRIAATENGYLTSLWLTCFWISSLLSFLVLLLGGNRLSRHERCWQMIMLVLTLMALYSTGNRGMVLNPIVVMFILYNHTIKLVSLRPVLRFSAIGFCVVSLMGFSRNFFLWGPAYLVDIASAGYPNSIVWMIPALEYVKNGANILGRIVEMVPAHMDHTLGILTISPIGNVAWHLIDKMGLDAGPKIVSIDYYLKSLFNLDFTGFGVAGSLLTGFFLDGGVFGVFLGMFLCGTLSAFLYWRMVSRHSLTAIFLWSYWSYHLLFSLYGSIFSYITNLTIPLTLYLVLKNVTTDRQATARLAESS